MGRPDKRALLLDGDGSLLMSLISLVTVAQAAATNLCHFVFENGTYEANGRHLIPGSGRVDFSSFARAAGNRGSRSTDDLAVFEDAVAGVLREEGPVFIDLKVEPGPAPKCNYELMHSGELRAAFKAALAGQPGK